MLDVNGKDVQSAEGLHGLDAHGEVLPRWLYRVIHEEGRLTLTDYEAGRLLGISRGSVRAAIAEQEIQVVRLGRRLLIPVAPLLSLIGLSLPNPTRQDDPLRLED